MTRARKRRVDLRGAYALKHKQRFAREANPFNRELGYYGSEPRMRISEAKSPARD